MTSLKHCESGNRTKGRLTDRIASCVPFEPVFFSRIVLETAPRSSRNPTVTQFVFILFQPIPCAACTPASILLPTARKLHKSSERSAYCWSFAMSTLSESIIGCALHYRWSFVGHWLIWTQAVVPIGACFGLFVGAEAHV